MATKEQSPLEIIENRIQNPLDGRVASSLGLSWIVGTHGTTVDSVYQLARDGYFSGGSRYTSEGDRRFYITPNLRFGGWRRTEYAEKVNELKDGGYDVHPVSISMGYAESSEPDSTGDNEYEATRQSDRGVVIGFSKFILPLIERVDVGEIREEPEAVLRKAPPVEAVRVIYPMNKLALDALHEAIASLR